MLSMLWNEPSLRNYAPLPRKFDLFISSDWTQPPPTIATHRATILHDLIFREHPETVDPLIISTQTKRLEHVTKECDLIWCDSESTKEDLLRFYPNTQGSSSVQYPGVTGPNLKPNVTKLPDSLVPKQYFFAVGKIEPRKNLVRLIEAFKSLISRDGYKHLSLAIAGPKGWDVETHSLDHPQIHLLGSVDDNQLALLYHQALGFVYPSLYEGFGIPPLEAMSLGCPVILSNTSSLPEIATRQSALFIDPNSTESIVSAMRTIASDENLRIRLIEEGYKNVKRFTWERYVQSMLESIEAKCQ